MAEAKIEVFEFIEIWCNRKRIHAALEYLRVDETFLHGSII